MIDPRIWELEHQGVMRLDDMVMKRAELAFDELINKMIDDDKRSSANKTWYALKIARNTRLNPDSGGTDDIVSKIL